VARAVVDEGLALASVARACGVSANTAILWVRRYRARGVDGLLPAVALPPVLTPATEARREAVVTLRRAHPEVGARRIRDILQRFHALGVSERTVRRILHEEGLSAPPTAARVKARPAERRFERAEPNQLWQSDLFTFLLRRHERVYVAAFLDDCARFVVALVLAHHQRASLVLEALARGIAEYGAPREVLTDQGRQYTAWRGETSFEEELRRHGIRHVKARPHHPQTLGKIERFWKTLWEEFLARTVFADFADCERRVALFVQHYNFQRPHQALGGLVPADRFFRAAPQVRAAIEAQVAANALRAAQQQPPQTPFYLVGQLGDRAVSIAASGTGLKVKVGETEQRIPLGKEPEDDYPQTARWRGSERDAAPRPSAAAAADAEVAAAGAGPGPDREGPVPAGAGRAVGPDAGDRRNSGGEALTGHVLSARDAGAPGDADGPDPRGRDGERGGGPGGDDAAAGDAGGAGAAAGAGEAAGGAAAGADAEGDPAGAADDGGPAAGAPTLDRVWGARFAAARAGAEDEPEPFDPDAGWRGRLLSWARKLAGATAPGGGAREGEDQHGEEASGVHGGPASPGLGPGPVPDDAGGAGGHADGERGGALAGALPAALPDAAASGADGVRDGAGDEAARPPGPAAARGDAGGGERAAAAGEHAAAGAGGADRAAAAAGEYKPDGAESGAESAAASGADKAGGGHPRPAE
jgi:transposase InsO family protein